METTNLHDDWAVLLAYPRDASVVDAIAESLAQLCTAVPECSADLGPLAEFVRRVDVGELQERYTRTFDGTTTRALELGWHLFGESYSRGAFLVRMRQLLCECGVFETHELPDHLGCVLAVLARSPENVCAALVQGSVLPAIDKLLAGFEDKEDPYRRMLQGLRHYLDARHPSSLAIATEVRVS